jgi:hypothetical protein
VHFLYKSERFVWIMVIKPWCCCWWEECPLIRDPKLHDCFILSTILKGMSNIYIFFFSLPSLLPPFLSYWGLNTVPHACYEGALPLVQGSVTEHLSYRKAYLTNYLEKVPSLQYWKRYRAFSSHGS